MNKKIYSFLRSIQVIIIFISILSIIAIVNGITNNDFFGIITIFALCFIAIAIDVYLYGPGHKYYFVIPLNLDECLKIINDWLQNQGFKIVKEYNNRNFTWLHRYYRNQYRTYVFYKISDNLTVITEIIYQKDLIYTFDIEAKEISDVIAVPIYYIPQVHGKYFEEFYKGASKKKLEINDDEGSVPIQLEENGKVIQHDEIKKRGYWSEEDYINGLNFPFDIHKKDMRKIIKKIKEKKLIVYRRPLKL